MSDNSPEDGSEADRPPRRGEHRNIPGSDRDIPAHPHCSLDDKLKCHQPVKTTVQKELAFFWIKFLTIRDKLTGESDFLMDRMKDGFLTFQPTSSKIDIKKYGFSHIFFLSR
jgi:hypothetical protein